MTREDIEAYVSSLRNGSAQRLTAVEVYEAGNLDRLLKPEQTSGPERLGLGNLDGGVEGGGKTPSEIARSWQGTGKYPGIDDYVDVTVEKGTVLYRGEPNGTEYFTTLDAIEQSGRDATKLFEGLQVEKNPIHGYRGEMQGYIFNEDIASAYGITNANPQFGKGGLPQYYVPDVQDLIEKGILTPVDNIKLNK